MPPGRGIVAGGFLGARLAVAGGTGDDIRVSDAEREAALKVLGELTPRARGLDLRQARRLAISAARGG
jgi:hypothetical protein